MLNIEARFICSFIFRAFSLSLSLFLSFFLVTFELVLQAPFHEILVRLKLISDKFSWRDTRQWLPLSPLAFQPLVCLTMKKRISTPHRDN